MKVPAIIAASLNGFRVSHNSMVDGVKKSVTNTKVNDSHISQTPLITPSHANSSEDTHFQKITPRPSPDIKNLPSLRNQISKFDHHIGIYFPGHGKDKLLGLCKVIGNFMIGMGIAM